MCDCKRLSAHNFVEVCLQTTPTTSEVLRCRSPSRHSPSSLTHARRYADEMSYSRRSPSLRWISLWATITVSVESPTDLFVASHWLERSSSRLSVTLLVFSRGDHSTLQVLTTFYVFFISTFIEGLLQKHPWGSIAHQTSRGPRPWRHTPRLIVMHVVFRSLLKIFGYAAKQACKMLQCIKAKLLEPPFTIQGSTLEPVF